MDKKYLKRLNQFVIDYYKSRGDKSLKAASEYCCSEMARYLGHHILGEISEAEVFILKGRISEKSAHDILLIHQKGGYTLLDPTAWQFFNEKKSILVGECDSLISSLDLAVKAYGGKWSVSEELDRGISKEELSKLKKILDEIIIENCR
jgi:hypothetical protein